MSNEFGPKGIQGKPMPLDDTCLDCENEKGEGDLGVLGKALAAAFVGLICLIAFLGGAWITVWLILQIAKQF